MAYAKASVQDLITNLIIFMCALLPLVMGMTEEPKVPALFIFGNSLVDGGTNNYIPHSSAQANFPPYGETFFHFPTGRFTDGRTVFDFIANLLGMPFPPPFLKPGANFSHGSNFASGGSGLLDSTGKQWNIIPFSHQIEQFMKFSYILTKNHGIKALKCLLEESIFGISTGANDVGYYFTNATLRKSVMPQDFIKMLLSRYRKYLTRLYHGGARKVIVLDIPPVGCTPGSRLLGLAISRGGCFESANQMAVAYNAKLKQMLHSLNRNLTGAVFLYINSYDFVLNIIEHGKAFGFSDTTSACCGAGAFNAVVDCGRGKSGRNKPFLCKKPNRYLFWDRTHPTERVHHLVADEIWSGNPSFIFPFNLTTLIQSQSQH
eukprot:Gb_03963 [translate_table: standard]